MIADPAIRNDWQVVYRSCDLHEGAIQPIVNGQRPALRPEEFRRKLHVRAEKLSVLYRRSLHEMGATGATN